MTESSARRGNGGLLFVAVLVVLSATAIWFVELERPRREAREIERGRTATARAQRTAIAQQRLTVTARVPTVAAQARLTVAARARRTATARVRQTVAAHRTATAQEQLDQLMATAQAEMATAIARDAATARSIRRDDGGGE